MKKDAVRRCLKVRSSRKLLSQALEAKCDDEIRLAVKKLTSNPDADLGDSFRKIEAYSKMATVMKVRRSRRLVWPLVIGAVALVVVSVLAVARAPMTRVVLNISTTSVALKLAKDWSWSGELQLDGSLARFEGLTAVEAPSFPRLSRHVAEGQVETGVYIWGGHTELDELKLDSSGGLEIEVSGYRSLALFFTGARLEALLWVADSARLSAAESATGTRTHDVAGPSPGEAIELFVEKPGAERTEFRFRLVESWVIRNMYIDSLAFFRKGGTSAGERAFVPAITEGTLDLDDVSRSVLLRQGDHLSFTGVKGRLVELRIDDNISLVFEGTARRIRTGPEGFQREITPALLEYLYHQRRLGFLWSTAVLIYGALWAIRRTVFS